MAEKSPKTTRNKKSNKNGLIIGCCITLVAIIAIIIAVVLINKNSLNDGYFVSDDTKYVLTIESDDLDDEDADQYAPLKTHLVYTYEGDTVTGLKSYYEYADAASAQSAYNAMKDAMAENASDEISQMELNGKYIIVTASEDTYKDMTASDVKQQIEFMETLKNMDNSDDTNDADDANDADDTTDTDTNDNQD